MYLTGTIIRRAVHTSASRNIRHRIKNPGARHTLKELSGDEELLADDPEGFGGLEANFNAVHINHRQREKELKKERESVRQYMVKHKYFRGPHLPNLLTFAEKEQIRILHARDPNDWTVEHLAESFPATPDIIQKTLKAKWRPTYAKRIQKHDEAVLRNWEKLNEIQLPQELKDHFNKFAARNLRDLAQQSPNPDWQTGPVLPKPKRQEFLSIITSCKKYAESKEQVQQKLSPPTLEIKPLQLNTLNPNDSTSETYLLDAIKDKRKMRLHELKQLKLSPTELSFADEASKPKNMSPLQQTTTTTDAISGTEIILNTIKAAQSTDSASHVDHINQFQESEIVVSVEDQKRYEMSTVKDRIYIPRKLWRKHGTFRVEDCYYDDDGEFLYRVPGMTGKPN